MNYSKINKALNELQERLIDAQKGYFEIATQSDNVVLQRWAEKLASKRKMMSDKLETFQVETTISDGTLLGDFHRLYIKLKSFLTWNDTESLINEIETGCKKLLNDYNQVLQEIEFTDEILLTLSSQKVMIKKDLEELVTYKEKVKSFVA